MSSIVVGIKGKQAYINNTYSIVDTAEISIDKLMEITGSRQCTVELSGYIEIRLEDFERIVTHSKVKLLMNTEIIIRTDIEVGDEYVSTDCRIKVIDTACIRYATKIREAIRYCMEEKACLENTSAELQMTIIWHMGKRAVMNIYQELDEGQSYIDYIVELSNIVDSEVKFIGHDECDAELAAVTTMVLNTSKMIRAEFKKVAKRKYKRHIYNIRNTRRIHIK